jgi:hypothetical protein
LENLENSDKITFIHTSNETLKGDIKTEHLDLDQKVFLYTLDNTGEKKKFEVNPSEISHTNAYFELCDPELCEEYNFSSDLMFSKIKQAISNYESSLKGDLSAETRGLYEKKLDFFKKKRDNWVREPYMKAICFNYPYCKNGTECNFIHLNGFKESKFLENKGKAVGCKFSCNLTGVHRIKECSFLHPKEQEEHMKKIEESFEKGYAFVADNDRCVKVPFESLSKLSIDRYTNGLPIARCSLSTKHDSSTCKFVHIEGNDNSKTITVLSRDGKFIGRFDESKLHKNNGLKNAIKNRMRGKQCTSNTPHMIMSCNFLHLKEDHEKRALELED